VETEPQPPTGAERDARRAARVERREADGRQRLPLETPFMRAVATGGIVGISVAIAAILGSQDVQGWLIGLVISVVSLVLAALLWSSRRL
jgi:hypothetical protein